VVKGGEGGTRLRGPAGMARFDEGSRFGSVSQQRFDALALIRSQSSIRRYVVLDSEARSIEEILER